MNFESVKNSIITNRPLVFLWLKLTELAHCLWWVLKISFFASFLGIALLSLVLGEQILSKYDTALFVFLVIRTYIEYIVLIITGISIMFIFCFLIYSIWKICYDFIRDNWIEAGDIVCQNKRKISNKS